MTEALAAVRALSECEGILPALESAHALAGAPSAGRSRIPARTILVGLSGRGDKDMPTLQQTLLAAAEEAHEPAGERITASASARRPPRAASRRWSRS